MDCYSFLNRCICKEEGKEGAVENVSNVSKEKWSEILEKMAPEDFKYKQ